MKSAEIFELPIPEIARGEFRSNERFGQCNGAHAYNTRTSRAKFLLKMGLRLLAQGERRAGALIANRK
jgi:hypothetical protein